VITGFNTDIEHDGVVYHVQTEDKGLDTPIILSLVYSGGAILASKRAPYKDLIAQGFSDEALSERLKRQHKLICAAIHSGRINDLKKMGAVRPESPAVDVPEVIPELVEANPEEAIPELVETAQEEVIPVVESAQWEVIPELAETAQEEVIPELVETAQETEETTQELVETETVEVSPLPNDEFEFDYSPSQQWIPPQPAEEVAPSFEDTQPIPAPVTEGRQPVEAVPYTVHDPRRQYAVDPIPPDEGLVITLLDDEVFYAAENRTLRVLVTNFTGDDHKPLGNVAVSIKILGTTFRPLIYTVKTEKDGVASVATQIPEFTSGRAAVLVRAVAKDQAAELRRVIHPGK
jgi:hypothetical protein